jgi:hypothetical protein
LGVEALPKLKSLSSAPAVKSEGKISYARNGSAYHHEVFSSEQGTERSKDFHSDSTFSGTTCVQYSYMNICKPSRRHRSWLERVTLGAYTEMGRVLFGGSDQAEE